MPVEAFRCPSNPIIGPEDVKPSRKDFEVFGAFNAAVARLGDEIILLVRVAERPVNAEPDAVAAALYDVGAADIVVRRFARSDAEIDFSDPRLIVTPNATYLTSLSHLRVARSKDGLNFKVEEAPAIFPANEYETCGIEDARVSLIEGTYYITYVAVCPWGVTTCLASTVDFVSFERHGVIFCPENKDVAIFPERLGGRYYALHRPVSPLFKTQDIWLSESADLKCWGNHRRLMAPRAGFWDEIKVGASAVPVRTEAGWLEVYHGVDRNNRYCLGALLLDGAEPYRIIARAAQPLLEPQTDYERSGVFGNVVFSCGLLFEQGKLRIYYGAADTSIACAEIAVQNVLQQLRS